MNCVYASIRAYVYIYIYIYIYIPYKAYSPIDIYVSYIIYYSILY